jgi:phosphoribosylformylglycinamidine synthase subunit PurS
MKKFKAEINIMPLKALLDPQGKAVTSGLKNLGLSEISMEIAAASKEEANEKVEVACKKLLANAIMESYQIEVVEEN